MNKFDRYIKNRIKNEDIDIPKSSIESVEKTLSNLPEYIEQKKQLTLSSKVSIACCLACFVTIFLLPNISIAYAKAIEKIPIIGDIVRVVTIRNYFYSDGKHEMDINVPKIDDDENSVADYINKDVDELTNELIKQFYKDYEMTEGNGYGSINVDYEVLRNSEYWFTLKLSVHTTAASSNNYFKFYHIDKKNNKIVNLSDLFTDSSFSDIIVQEIKSQMVEQMQKDDTVTYWINDSIIGNDFASIDANQNFYINEQNELVIVFDKYEVGPGSMGTPEFIIRKNVIVEILKKEYKTW